jgi:O-antigen ligase
MLHPALGAIALAALLAASRPLRSPSFVVESMIVVALMAASAGLAGGVPGAALAVGAMAVFHLWCTRARHDDVQGLARGAIVGVFAHLVAGAWHLIEAVTWRVSGLTFHPNALGALMVLALSLLMLAPPAESRRERLLRVVAVVAAALLLLLSGSRSAVAAVGAVALALLALSLVDGRHWRAALTRWGLVGVPLGVVVTLLLLVWPAGPVRSDAGADLLGREGLWAGGLVLVLERPVLGHGPGGWQRRIAHVEPALGPERFPHAHSGVLEVAIDLGLVGAAAVLALVAALARALVRSVRSGARGGPAAVAAFVGFATVNVADMFLYHGFFMGLLVLIVGVGVAGREPAVRDAPG